MKNKVLVAVIMLVLWALYGNSALADYLAEDVVPMYENTGNLSAKLTIHSEQAQCEGTTQGLSSNTRTKLTLTLQKRVSGASWTSVVTWNKQGTGKALVMIKQSYPTRKGYDYRVKVVSRIVNSEGVILEKITKYSAIISN